MTDFASLPFVEDPQLSPDGRHLAAKLSVDGRQMLGVIDLFTPGSKPVLLAMGVADFNDWTWVNDQWLAVRVGRMIDFEGSSFYITRVAGVAADGSAVKPVNFSGGGQTASIIWTAHDGSPRILIAEQKSTYMSAEFWPQVEEVDVSTGKVRRVVDPIADVMNWYADPDGVVRVGVGYNDNRRSSRLLYRDTNGKPFKTVDRANARKRETLTLPILLGGGGTLTVASPGGFDALHEVDLSTLAIGKRLWGADGYDIDDVVLNSARTAAAAVRYTSDRPRMHWLDPAMAGVQADLDRAVGTRSADIVSWSRDMQRLLVHVARAGDPDAYYYYDASAGGKMARIAFASAAIGDAALSPVSTFRYKARDGLEVEAVLTLPRGRDAKNLPLILMPHGGPEARDAVGYDWWAQFLADRGYAVLQPNYRGSTGYGEAFKRAGDGQWGLRMQDDLNDGVDAVVARGVADAKRVCIVGGSYGGYAAMRGAQRDGTRYRCAISIAGISDMAAMLTYDSRFLNANASSDSLRTAAPDLAAVSPLNDVNGFAAPILLIHGKKDLRVPVSQSRRLADKLRGAGKPVDYLELPEADHHLSREADRRRMLQTIEAFLQKYNPAG